jgi:hypothetical protein
LHGGKFIKCIHFRGLGKGLFIKQSSSRWEAKFKQIKTWHVIYCQQAKYGIPAKNSNLEFQLNTNVDVNGVSKVIFRPLENRLSNCSVRPPFRQIHHPVYFPHCACARRFFLVRSSAVVSQDHSAVSVSTVRLGVQFRRPKAASPPQKLEVRAAGGRTNF